jgi:hypothetical protein
MIIVTLELYPRSGEKEITGALVERQLVYLPRQCSSTHTAPSKQKFLTKNKTPVVPQLAYSPGLSLALFLFLTWNFV